MQEIIIGPNQAGQRLDKFLHKYLPNAGSSFLYKMLRKKNITLNGKKANIPSIELKVGDVIQLKESSKDSALIKELADALGSKNPPAWLELDVDNLSAKVVRMPSKEDIDIPVEEQMIVELYSK